MKNAVESVARYIKISGFVVSLMIFAQVANAANPDNYVSLQPGKGFFTLSAAGKSAPILVNKNDFPGVLRAVKDLQTDIGKVTKADPSISLNEIPDAKEIVLIGTLGKSPLIDELVKKKKINVSGIVGKWETFLIQVVEKPFPKVDRALVIAGSDKRGTIFGIYDMSSNIGVSPWYWWADVPVQQQVALYIKPGSHSDEEPGVKYRGIFINDEAPALSGWTHEKNGGFNHKLYEKVFELILRMKGNYLWPAMWGNAFYDDDELNPKLADEYGIVIGTSHHEPMMRAHDEWRRYGKGPWNYDKNEASLKEFWKQSIERMGSNESLVTIGMRGDGDEPMSEDSNIALLERIVKDQREILGEVTGKDPSETPQVWALYKEVQEYYDRGMRVPDDVTLLLCDDNWGNIRKLPKLNEKPRKGGYGIYYHYDYVGGPRNYKWINTNQITRVWEQMNLAWEYGARQIWIVNVGDIKPMEFPIEFFLDYAWNPGEWTLERLEKYTQVWSQQQFGSKHAVEIADIMSKYTQYNSRRKPELLSPETYSLLSYKEAETVVADYNALLAKAEEINKVIPTEYKDAYYQLVLHPVQASANINELYFTVAKNRMYAAQGRAATSEMADKAKALFEKDADISHYYNKTLAGGKWNHMMDQTHIGYTYWQQPEKNAMPEVHDIEVKSGAEMGVAVEGSTVWWPMEKTSAELPAFDKFNKQKYYFEIFNRGSSAFDYTVKPGADWVLTDLQSGKIEKEQRVWVSVDWTKVPVGKHRVPVTISGANGAAVTVFALITNSAGEETATAKGFFPANGYVSMEAAHFTNAVETEKIKWKVIEGLGRTHSGVAPFPVTAESQVPKGKSPRLEYAITLQEAGEVKIHAYFSPTLNFNDAGLKYAVSIDDEAPQTINIHSDTSLKTWEKWVANNININVTTHKVVNPGQHVIKIWMVDPGLVLQKIVVDAGGLKPSYLGPPESFNKN